LKHVANKKAKKESSQMRTNCNFLRIACRTAAFGFLSAAAALTLQAQQTTSVSSGVLDVPSVQASAQASTVPAAPVLLASETAPGDFLAAETPAYSSSVGADEMASAESFKESLNLGSSATQPPPRRSYGRPNYSDSHTNSDGSNKYTFFIGAGLTVPVSTTSNDLATSYKFQLGGGRNFNKHLGVMLQFDWDNFGMQTATLNNLLAIYNSAYIDAGLSSLGGSSHVWSFTLNPVYTISQGDKWGTYVVGGVGFYHKVADFTTPGTAEVCEYYGCFDYTANQVIDQYVSNAIGFNGGGGVTYKFSRFAGERFYVEGRYVFVDNSPRSYVGTTAANTPSSGTAFDAFPQNGNHTTYIPITLGIRF
jgi:hypothetical protein